MVLLLNENGEFELHYDGNYHRCLMKYVVDRLYTDCDTMVDFRKSFDELFPNLQPIPVDTVKIEKKTKGERI